MKIRLEKSLAQNKTSQILVPVIAVFMALLFCGVFLAVTGRDPFEVYQAMFAGALGSEYGISETLVKMIPLALCGLGIAVAFRMQIWNIGAEGQFYMGACGATWVPLTFPNLPFIVVLFGTYIPILHRQIIREEDFLKVHYSGDYSNYAKKVRRYL